MKPIKIYTCFDKPRTFAGFTYIELGGGFIGCFLGLFIGEGLGMVFGAVLSFLFAGILVRKNKSGLFKKLMYKHFPHIGRYGYFKRCRKKYYL